MKIGLVRYQSSPELGNAVIATCYAYVAMLETVRECRTTCAISMQTGRRCLRRRRRHAPHVTRTSSASSSRSRQMMSRAYTVAGTLLPPGMVPDASWVFCRLSLGCAGCETLTSGCLTPCRFAPHLEKCLGKGRNAARMANRRLAA